MTVTSYTDTGAPGGTVYYSVETVCTAANTSFTSNLNPQQAAASIQPATPSNFAETTITNPDGSKFLQFSWSAVPGATSYTISEGSTSGGPYPNNAPPSQDGTVTTYTVPVAGIPAGTYYYVIAANSMTASGTTLTSPQSNQVAVTVP